MSQFESQERRLHRRIVGAARASASDQGRQLAGSEGWRCCEQLQFAWQDDERMLVVVTCVCWDSGCCSQPQVQFQL